MLHSQVERSASVKPGDCRDLNILLSVEFPPFSRNSCLTSMLGSVDHILSCQILPMHCGRGIKEGH